MRRFGLTTLTALALATAPALGQQYRELLKNDPLLEALTLPRMVTLGDLLKAPEAYRGIHVRLTIAFSDLGKLENPFFTRFTTNNYMNFAAWDDSQAIWQKDEFLKSYPLLFARRTTPVCDDFADAKRFDRFAVEAVVQDTFRGKPWIEVLSARKEEASLSHGALRHLHHAHQQAERGNYSLAQGEVNRALNAPLPDHHRVSALALAARIEEKLGDVAGARARWDEALCIDPENKTARSERDRLALREHQDPPVESGASPATEVPAPLETPEFLEPPKDGVPPGDAPQGEAPKGEPPQVEPQKVEPKQDEPKQETPKPAETPAPGGAGETPPGGGETPPAGGEDGQS